MVITLDIIIFGYALIALIILAVWRLLIILDAKGMILEKGIWWPVYFLFPAFTRNNYKTNKEFVLGIVYWLLLFTVLGSFLHMLFGY